MNTTQPRPTRLLLLGATGAVGSEVLRLALAHPRVRRVVDRDLPVALARAAQRLGAHSLALNSSLGASARGNFYLRTKFEAEQALRALGFASYTVVRPSLIDAQRTQSRPGERVGLWVSNLLGPLVPRRYRPVSATAIAYTLLRTALEAVPGERIIESEHIA